MNSRYIIKKLFIRFFFVFLFYLFAHLIMKYIFIYDVNAAVLSHQSSSFNQIVDNNTAHYNYSITNGPFANRPQGEVKFSVILNKVSGTPTAPIVMIRNVYLSDNNSLFYCSLGTSSLTNSTFGGTIYSLTCPVDNISSVGLKTVTFDFADNQQNETSSYRFTFSGLFTYVSTSINNNVNVDTSGTTTAINNQITNDNQNTQSIINNNNSNSGLITGAINDEIESQKVCNDLTIDRTYISDNGKYLDSSGNILNSAFWGITDYLNIKNSISFKVLYGFGATGSSFCFYNSSKELISCVSNNGLSDNQVINVPNNVYFVRFSINPDINIPQFIISSCKNGNQALADSQQQINNSINNVNDTINDDDVTAATDTGDDFFQNFQVDGHGLSTFVTTPFRLIQSFTTQSCSPLSFQLPFVHNVVTIPCFRPIIQEHFSTFLVLFQLITTGLICYRVCINTFSIVKRLQNPTDDRIEVLNL